MTSSWHRKMSASSFEQPRKVDLSEVHYTKAKDHCLAVVIVPLHRTVPRWDRSSTNSFSTKHTGLTTMPVQYYYEEDDDEGPSVPAKDGILEDPDDDTVRQILFWRENTNTGESWRRTHPPSLWGPHSLFLHHHSQTTPLAL